MESGDLNQSHTLLAMGAFSLRELVCVFSRMRVLNVFIMGCPRAECPHMLSLVNGGTVMLMCVVMIDPFSLWQML